MDGKGQGCWAECQGSSARAFLVFPQTSKLLGQLDSDNDNRDDDDGSAGGEDEDDFDEEKDDPDKDGDGPLLTVMMMLIRDALPH